MGAEDKIFPKVPEAGSLTVKAMDTQSFDEGALSALTAKIEKGFRNAMAPKSQSRTPHHALQNEGPIDRLAKPSKHKESKKTSTGRKRDARGNIKRPSGESKIHKAPKREQITARLGEQKVLLQEILSLGGTEDDFDLIVGVPSDEDHFGEDTATPQPLTVDRQFAKRLSKFVTELGIGTQAMHDATGSRSSEEDDREEEKEEDSYTKSTPGFSRIEETAKSSPSQDDRSLAKSPKTPNRLMFDARPDWHGAVLPNLPNPDLSDAASNPDVAAELKRHAFALLEADGSLYSSKNLSSTSSHRFLSTIMNSGTLSDKISALTLVVQESPVHTIKSFESLLALAKKRSRGQAVTALGALKDLLGVGVILPSDRRLRSFEDQPGLLGTLQEEPVGRWKPGDVLPGQITNAHLISWAYEDWLKDTYFDVLKVLEIWCNDEVEFARGRAVNYVYELLREKPEQESNLLRLLVNKLGDPDKKIASRTSYLILQLQTTHPLMKPIIIGAIENELLLRPGQSSHAKYYAINTLNQTILSAREDDVAHSLLSIYFNLFVSILKKPDVGVAVSAPIVNRKGQIQGGGGQMGKKAKEKAKKQDTAKHLTEETTEKMISAVLTGVNRALPFAKSDDFTLEKHMDMLFKITHSSNFNTSVQALILIQQLSVSKHLAEERFYRTLYESLLDPRLVMSSKHAMYLNLLFRALKSDVNIKRVKAFAKRLLQIITLHQPPFICGVLYLLGELEGTFPGLRSLVSDPEESEEMDEEVFLDVPDDTETRELPAQALQSGHIHPKSTIVAGSILSRYDGRKRDPEHSNAEKSCLWELLPFVSHFHPSVAMFASRLLDSGAMPTKPDLGSHTLIHFLDRFVYRNAKAAADAPRGTSIMQPLAGGDGTRVFMSNRPTQRQKDPLNSESFWRRKAEDVALDEVFFHKYFSEISKGKQLSVKRQKSVSDARHATGEDNESENEDEDEIWQALIESRPEVEGNSGDDSDLEMFDLDESEDGTSIGDGFDLDSENESLAESDVDMKNSVAADGILSDEEDIEAVQARLFSQEMRTNLLPGETKQDKRNNESKRRKLKNLPTFASTDDYAEMLEDDDEGV